MQFLKPSRVLAKALLLIAYAFTMRAEAKETCDATFAALKTGTIVKESNPPETNSFFGKLFGKKKPPPPSVRVAGPDATKREREYVNTLLLLAGDKQSAAPIIFHAETHGAGPGSTFKENLSAAFKEYGRDLSAMEENALQKLTKMRSEVLDPALEHYRNGAFKLALDERGQETIALDTAAGIPDAKSFSLARKLEDIEGYRYFLPPDELSVVDRMVAAKKVAYEHAWASPHYANLQTIRYTEAALFGFENRPIRDYVEEQRWHNPKWWRKFSVYNEAARITGNTSRSPLKRLYGANSERMISWPAQPGFVDSLPDLSRLRFAENVVDGQSKSLEVLASDGPGGAVKGYFFVNLGGQLVPSTMFDGHKIGESCIRCHHSAANSSVMTFNPVFLNSAEAFRAVGYRNDRVIEELLKSGHR